LIEYFLKDKDYKSKCDNEASGGGDMEDSDTYIIYVVLRSKLIIFKKNTEVLKLAGG